MKYIVGLCISLLVITACSKENKKESLENISTKITIPKIKYGYELSQYHEETKTIKYGESFGEIMDRLKVAYPKILTIAKLSKDVFDVRKIKAGNKYTILKAKDSNRTPQVFIYHHNKIKTTIVDFRDTIKVQNYEKPITRKWLTATGTIKSSLSESVDQAGLSPSMAFRLSDIYAWTIDFFRLQKKDAFKVVYEQLYIDDTIKYDIGEIRAVYFKHVNKPFYAFRYIPDSITGIEEYYDENTVNLRRAFLKAPLKFSRISSRYNLRRKIAFYGRVKPHLGTDFAAPVGSPIMATANGVVIASRYKGANGNYVKIKHNNTYSTQYLHMKRRKVKVGDYVKQGDVIGWVGMTGNTSGPHVCYRFWKNGRQVDPLKQKLPAADPMKEEVIPHYKKYIEPYKKQLDELSL